MRTASPAPSAAPSPAAPGAARATDPQPYADATTYPPLTRTYMELSAAVKERRLLRRTPWFYRLLMLALGIGLAGCAAGFLLLGPSWFQLLIAGALGIVLTQTAFVAHEAAHRQVLAGGRSNDRLARILAAGVVGMSYAWWNSKHTRHHANPNRVDKDPDIDVDTVSFLAKDAARTRGVHRLFTRHQGWLFFPLLTLEGLNLHFQSLRHLMGPGKVKGRWVELGLLALRFTLVFGAVFWLLPLGMAFAFLGVQLAVVGVYMGASFAPNHKGMPVIAPDAKLDFFSKQVRTSRNIRGGWWATILMGGLNYQVEHHLFPSMPRPHLARARALVMESCRAHDVPYVETSLWRSYGIVVAYLNRVGLAARDPFECPLMTQFRRA